MEENNLFVRICSSNLEESNKKTTKIRNKTINANKYLIAGGFYNKKGGTMVFKARNMEEVEKITKENIFIKDMGMRYDVVILPKNI